MSQQPTSTQSKPCVPSCSSVRRPLGNGRTAEHLVQFYDRDEVLIRAVGDFLSGGLSTRASAVVIATDAHRRGFASFLETAGFNLAAAIEQGTYVALDADETLGKIMVGDLPDAGLFNTHVGSLVTRLTAGGQPLVAFGEMVALLWAAGKTDAAIRLEELWNSLAERHVFTLFCAYPIGGFASEQAGQPFLHVCKTHTRVLPVEDVEIDDYDEKQLAIAVLQQKAAALTDEVRSRKNAEQILQKREAELRAFFETASLGLHSVDRNGVILWANPAELELLGYSSDEYVGRSITEFHADEFAITDILARLQRGEKIKDYKARLRCKDGTIKTVLIDSSVLSQNGEFLHTQCFTRDITEQNRAQEQNQHLAAIVESSDDAIVSKTLDGVIRTWNRSAERIFGYTADEVIGKSITIVIPPDRLEEEPQILARLRKGERVDHFETIRRRKDGTLINISLTISPIRDVEGQIIGASKIARDITEKKRTEAALAEAREQLTRTNEELEVRVAERTASLRDAVAQMEEFSYTVSHDLRAPLRGMQVYSQALLEDFGPTLDPEARHCLTRINENANRLDKMVTDVLTFSRISRTEIVLTRVALDKLVRDIIQHYPAMQPPRAIMQIERLHDILGHEPSLTQIVSNLLSNAVKFVPSGVIPSVHVWTESVGNGIRLFVKDNGIGINPALQSRLFRMFERVHPELPYEGTGVGLAIVRKASQRMGAEAGAQSDGKNGTTFWVQFLGLDE